MAATHPHVAATQPSRGSYSPSRGYSLSHDSYLPFHGSYSPSSLWQLLALTWQLTSGDYYSISRDSSSHPRGSYSLVHRSCSHLRSSYSSSHASYSFSRGSYSPTHAKYTPVSWRHMATRRRQLLSLIRSHDPLQAALPDFSLSLLPWFSQHVLTYFSLLLPPLISFSCSFCHYLHHFPTSLLNCFWIAIGQPTKSLRKGDLKFQVNHFYIEKLRNGMVTHDTKKNIQRCF